MFCVTKQEKAPSNNTLFSLGSSENTRVQFVVLKYCVRLAGPLLRLSA